MTLSLTEPISKAHRATLLTGCGLSVIALALCEKLIPGIPLAGFFFLPLMVAAVFIPRWAIFLSAVAIALLREIVEPLPFQGDVVTRLMLSLAALTGTGLFAGELFHNRRVTAELEHKSRKELQLRLDAEQEARALVESSPAAVITVDSEGKIAKANEAACRILGIDNASPVGEAVERYIPLLAKLLNSKRVVNLTRTMVEAGGRRANGEAFYSQAWVSAYESASGHRLMAILLDVTDQIRDREEGGLRQLLSNSRIIAGAVSHELRNLAAAASVLHHNASGQHGVKDSADFAALGKVIESMLKLASEDLSDTSEETEDGLDVGALLQDLRMIISPKFEESGCELDWEIAERLPEVRANHSGLLQVCLNMAQNSCNVLQNRPGGRLRITAYALPESVLIRFSDNGPGISSAEKLFQPFQTGASSTGLGLFVSRAIIRTFGGELHHTQRPGDCCFIIELPPLAAQQEDAVA